MEVADSGGLQGPQNSLETSQTEVGRWGASADGSEALRASQIEARQRALVIYEARYAEQRMTRRLKREKINEIIAEILDPG